MTDERKRQIREAAFETKGGLIQVKNENDMQQPQVQQLITVLETLVEAIIELTEP